MPGAYFTGGMDDKAILGKTKYCKAIITILLGIIYNYNYHTISKYAVSQ